MTETIETNRYARKTVTVKGLMQGTHDSNAKKIIAEHGIMWDLTGKTDDLQEKTIKTTTTSIEGDCLPSGLTTAEEEWVVALAETHGLEVGIVEEEESVSPVLPYMGVPIRFSHGAPPAESTIWSDLQFRVNGADATVKLDRCSQIMILTIEGKNKDDVASHQIDVWIQTTVKKVRDALKAAGFDEGELEIDCEVIMGAEREAQCDPSLMRSLLTTDKESEEE